MSALRHAVVSVLMLAGCGSGGTPQERAEQAAREELSKTSSCPMDRVTVTSRADLRPFDLQVGRASPPAADVAADPGRLAVWTERQQKVEDGYNRDLVIEATGCDAKVFYVCGQAEGSNQSVVTACRVAVHPPAASP